MSKDDLLTKPIEIQTTLKRCCDFPDAFDFMVAAVPLEETEGSYQEGRAVATLSGVLCDFGYLPHEESAPYFDLFDSRDNHAHEAYHLIETEIDRIVTVLGNGADVEAFGGIILLERAFVQEKYRGKDIALRLMREARAVLGGIGRLAILKAHPDGNDINDADLLRLAAYYQKDRVCGFKSVSHTEFPGWLVANWEDGGTTELDQRWL